MKTEVWNFLELMYDDANWPKSDPGMCVEKCWDDHWHAMEDLVSGFAEVDAAADAGSLLGTALDNESMEHPGVVAMLAAPQVMLLVIQEAIDVLASQHREELVVWLGRAQEKYLRTAIVLAIASSKLESCRSAGGQALLKVLADRGESGSTEQKAFAVQGLGKAKQISDSTVNVVVGLAGDKSQPQPLRSIALESLMDMGPVAVSAIPALQEILENELDDDLRQFAWAALKCVTAPSREHPEGGTVADHMRRLFTAESDE